jgi:hypothetical protein
MTTTHNMKKMAGKALLSGGLALAALGLASGTAQAFNPQPEPPGKPIPTAGTAAVFPSGPHGSHTTSQK